MFLKVIECLEQNILEEIDYKINEVQNKWTEYKIFELKYTNRNITS